MNKQILERKYPADWAIKPLSSFARDGGTNFVDGPFGSDLKVSDYTESGIRILQLQNLGDGYFIDKNKIYTSRRKATQLARCIAKPGDLIIAKMADPLARAAVLPDAEVEYLIVADLIKLHPAEDVDSYYLASFINFSDFRKEADRLSTGTTRTRVSLSTLKRISLPEPPESVQKRIAQILCKVDCQIERTESLITKYQQIKAGLMHDLFTRGITANGKLRPPRDKTPELYKETPIGWIPREWEIVSIASVSEFITSGSRGWANYYDIEGGLFIRIGNLTREHPNFRWESVQRVRLPKYAEGIRTRVVPGDILISITADLGVAAVASNDLGEAYVNQHIALVRPYRSLINSRFLGHYLGTRQAQFRFQRLNDSGAKAGLNLPAIGRYLIPRPKDSDEAANIYSILDSIDTKIGTLRKDYEKLQMRKSGLMHDLLTGKVLVKVERGQMGTACG